MRFVDVNHGANRGLDVAGERFNLVEPAHSNFDDGGGVTFINFEQRHRHANFVVKIRGGLADFAERAQNGGSQIFRGSFAAGAGYRHDGNLETGAPARGDLLIGSQSIVDANHNAFNFRRAFADENGGGAFFNCVAGKILAVEIFALERHEQHAFSDFAAVGRNAGKKNLAGKIGLGVGGL